MRAYIPSYEVITPTSIEDVLEKLDRDSKGWGLLAGGTDVMVQLEGGELSQHRYIELRSLKELQGISPTDDFVTVGSLTTFSEIQSNPVILQNFPLLATCAKVVGCVAIQNRATLGGNIMNGSPAADSPPALLAYDACLELRSRQQTRWVAYHEFHTGYKQTIAKPNELLTRIRLPIRLCTTHSYFRKVGTRNAQAIAKVSLAALASAKGRTIDDIRIAMGSIAPLPLRCHKTEQCLQGRPLNEALIRKAQEILRGEISPIDDIRSTREYRLKVSLNLLREFLEGI